MLETNDIKMEDTTLIGVLIALISALGIKEIWQIIKKRIDIKAEKDKRGDNLGLVVIEELKNKIEALEIKIDELIEENQQCAVKLARMEERILLSAKNHSIQSYKKKNGNGNQSNS